MNERISKYFSSSKRKFNEEEEEETMYQRILNYAIELEPPVDISLPNKTMRWLFPHRHAETRRCMEEFYSKFYSDNQQRILMLGINPGRFGGGTTGVPFTDPIRLKTICQIESNFSSKAELSSQFIYEFFLEQYSIDEFYRSFFIGAICPLGLESNGRNMNYYDNKHLMKELLEHYIPEHLDKQIQLGCSRKVAICLGEGKNYSILEKLNEKYHYFETILKLAHPRYIMQYKRKMVDDYVQNYIKTCQLAKELDEK